MQKSKIILFGSSGLVGSGVLRHIKSHPQLSQATLLCPSRRASGSHVDFDSDTSLEAMMTGAGGVADAIVWCVGTTLKKAGSRQAFEDVDLQLPTRVFTLAKKVGVPRVLLVSAEGADESSPFFYSRVKGQLERRLRELHFYESTVYRPSLLIGHRLERRPVETVAQKVLSIVPWAIVPWSKNLRPVNADSVAQKIAFHLAERPRPGHWLMRSGDLQRS